MADPTGTVQAGQPAPAAPQPGTQTQTYQPPTGYSLVSEADLQAYRRHGEQVQGFKPLYDRLSKAGIKSEKDWDNYEPIVNTARDRKIDGKAFSSMFSPEAEADLNGGKQPQSIDIDALRKQMKDEVMGSVYEMRHTDERKNDSKVVDAALAKVLGTDADDFTKELTKRSVKDWLEENRPTYPTGHPLADKFMAPLSPELAEKAVEYFTGLKAKQKGSEMADRASAANAQPKKVGTAAGGGASAPGKPTKNNADEDPDRPGYPSKARVEAAFAARRASRG